MYNDGILSRACVGFEFVKPWILCSVKDGLSFDRLEGRYCEDYPPICRTDFYGYRRLFYRNLNEIVSRESGKVYEKPKVHSGRN